MPWVLFQYHPHLHVAGWLIAYGEYDSTAHIKAEYTKVLSCGYRRYIHELTLIEVSLEELDTILQSPETIGKWYQLNRQPKKRKWLELLMKILY